MIVCLSSRGFIVSFKTNKPSLSRIELKSGHSSDKVCSTILSKTNSYSLIYNLYIANVMSDDKLMTVNNWLYLRCSGGCFCLMELPGETGGIIIKLPLGLNISGS